jgi:hypothetical protein
MSKPDPSDITEAEVNKAQRRWCKGLIAICKKYPDGDYKTEAEKFIDENYDFGNSPVFFRPTLAMFPHNFRTTKEGALSYFIGGNPRFGDEGFIKKGWREAKFDNTIEGKKAIQVHGNIGIAMGNVYLRQEVTVGGTWTVVDKVFVFIKEDNEVRLIVHNSALSNLPPLEKPEDKKSGKIKKTGKTKSKSKR